MFLIDKIEPLYFFLAIFIGFLMTYVYTPLPKIVYKYPSPDNEDVITYIDKANNCFKYKSSEVKCRVKK